MDIGKKARSVSHALALSPSPSPHQECTKNGTTQIASREHAVRSTHAHTHPHEPTNPVDGQSALNPPPSPTRPVHHSFSKVQERSVLLLLLGLLGLLLSCRRARSAIECSCGPVAAALLDVAVIQIDGELLGAAPRSRCCRTGLVSGWCAGCCGAGELGGDLAHGVGDGVGMVVLELATRHGGGHEAIRQPPAASLEAAAPEASEGKAQHNERGGNNTSDDEPAAALVVGALCWLGVARRDAALTNGGRCALGARAPVALTCRAGRHPLPLVSERHAPDGVSEGLVHLVLLIAS
mmetsp:Transcript_14814/g.35307  ORF Transcript_14814/g.35307 Transcript_14814/m.35307 type:complete len:294 (+) Transcript_14814:1506-2387(+)